MGNENNYACPCCGYMTLKIEPPRTYEICPICFWEDDGNVIMSDGINWGKSNKVSLRQAQRNFIAVGVCENQWRNDVRPPTFEDMRDPNWQTIDDLLQQTRLILMQEIHNAFKDVRLGQGVSIHQARAIDDYEDQQKARQIDKDIKWQDIPDEWIENFSDVLVFMDAQGLRHALPAYMLWCLKYQKVDTNSFDSTICCLRGYKSNRLFDLLTQPQKDIISKFLVFWETFFL